MRLFIALDISEAVRERLRRFMAELKSLAPDAKLVRAESLHITLKFLGEADARRCAAVRHALAGITQPAFALSVSGSGFFPNAGRPQVFWAGIEAHAALAELAHAIDTRCAALGYAQEERAFTPHLTLARAGSSDPRQSAARGDPPLVRIAHHRAGRSTAAFGKMDATEFHLYESLLSANGSIYKKLATFPLKRSP